MYTCKKLYVYEQGLACPKIWGELGIKLLVKGSENWKESEENYRKRKDKILRYALK